MVYPPLLPLMPHTSAASSRLNWRPPADLNGLVRFAERRNLVSALLPSHFRRSLHYANSADTINACENNPYSSCKSYIPIIRHWLVYLNPHRSRGRARSVSSNSDYLFMSMTCWVVHTERKRTFTKKKCPNPETITCSAGHQLYFSTLTFDLCEQASKCW